MDDSKSGKQKELDDFWDISSLLPQRKNPPPRQTRSTETVEITVEPRRTLNPPDVPQTVSADMPITKIPPENSNPGTSGDDNRLLVKKFIPPHTAEEFASQPKPDDEYEPRHNLIHRVRIFNWKTSYNYYEQFLRHAKKIKNLGGEECPHVPYFSYVPQFSQLTRPQLNWYLFWRTQAIRGQYIKTDYSYILLFVYEIINTGGHGNPAWGQAQLTGLWGAYRDEFPRFDKMLGEWVCDFSLIFRLPPPELAKSNIPAEAVQACTLKEFYMSDCGNDGGYSNMLLTFCSNYDYKTSKFAKGDAAQVFDEHIRGALSETVRRFSKDGGQILSGAGLEDSHIVRDAFAGALCSFEVKKKIEVDYCSFSRTHELRFLVTDIIKYSENKIRAQMGIKSRLSVYALPSAMRECIDAYFAGALPKRHKSAEPETHEYDKFYDLPASPVSPGRAAEIEQTSWETTERLVEAFADDTDAGGKKSNIKFPVDELLETVGEEPVKETEQPEQKGNAGPIEHEAPVGLAGKLSDLIEFVRMADQHDYAGQRRFAASRGMLPDLIADKINEISADIIGDVILTDDGEGYSFIEDYRKEVFDV